MSVEIVSGLVGGVFGQAVGEFLGKFRLWQVLILTLMAEYAAVFVAGIALVGFNVTVSRFHQFVTPYAVLIFLGLAVMVTFVAFMGGVARNGANKSNGDKR